MTTIEIIRILFASMDSGYIQENDDKIIDLLENAAEKLQELQQLVDDMLGDHYIDYLEFYTNRCRELEEETEKLRQDIQTLAVNSDKTCEYCKHSKPCRGKECAGYIKGLGLRDHNGYTHDWQWDCMDFEYGKCDMLENTPCNGCIKNNYSNFEYKGV